MGATYNDGPISVTIAESDVANDNSGSLVDTINKDASATTISSVKQAAQSAAKVGSLAASDGVAAGELVKTGSVTGLSGAAAGVVTSAVVFTNSYPTATDNVLLTLLDPSSQGIVFGGVWVTAVSDTGFTLNVNVTTAVTGSTFSVAWLALGH